MRLQFFVWNAIANLTPKARSVKRQRIVPSAPETPRCRADPGPAGSADDTIVTARRGNEPPPFPFLF